MMMDVSTRAILSLKRISEKLHINWNKILCNQAITKVEFGVANYHRKDGEVQPTSQSLQWYWSCGDVVCQTQVGM